MVNVQNWVWLGRAKLPLRRAKDGVSRSFGSAGASPSRWTDF